MSMGQDSSLETRYMCNLHRTQLSKINILLNDPYTCHIFVL